MGAEVKTKFHARPRFAFINISKPKDATRADNLKVVRSHAWDSGRPNKRRKRRLQYSFDLSVIPSPEKEPQITSSDKSHLNERLHPEVEVMDIRGQIGNAFLPVDLLRPIGSGRSVNPFMPFPIPSNERIVQLMDFAQRDARPMRVVWISVAMTDRGAFQLGLANAALLIARRNDLDDIQENSEALKYYTAALSSVNKRLQDPDYVASEELVGAILGFCCHDCTIRKNPARFQIHMNALERVVQKRGGIDTLESGPLRVMVNGIDVWGSVLFDGKPRFTVPNGFEYVPDPMAVSPLIHTSLQSLNRLSPNLQDMSTALLSIASLAVEIRPSILTQTLWEDEMFLGTKLNPVLHQVMIIPRMNSAHTADPEPMEIVLIKEALRLASIIFLGRLKQQFPYQPNEISTYGPRLEQLLNAVPVFGDFDLNLHLWASIMAALVNPEKDALAEKIAEIMTNLDLLTWEAAILRMKEIAWIEERNKHLTEDLGRIVMFKILNRAELTTY